MIEEWKLIKEWNGLTTSTSTHCTGDKLYVSNTGKVKLNDIELTLDKGLYINKGYEICIVGTSWPLGNMHRTIYQLFTGKLKKGCGWNIHHIDGNHYNNNINNLVQLTPFEHGKVHAEHDSDWGDNNPRNKKWVEYQQSRAEEVIELTHKWLKDRVQDYLKQKKLHRVEELKIQKEKTKIKNEQLFKEQKEKEIQEKLLTGNYYFNKAGVLIPKNRSTKGTTKSEDWKFKIALGVSNAWAEGKLTADKCCTNKYKQRYFDTETNKFYYA